MNLKRCALGLVLASAGAMAQDVPQQIAFSGRVADNGTLLTGAHNLEFRLFGASSGGTQVWSEQLNGLSIVQGLVDVQLGNNSPLTSSIFTGAPMWLEVVIDGSALTPRTPIASAPYAIKAATSATLGTLKPSDVQVRVSGTCAAGTAVNTIAANGTVTCQSVAGGGSGTVTSVATGAGLTGGPITSSGTIGLASSVQNWSSQPACGAGTHLQSIAANGTPTCVADATGTMTSVATGSGLTGGPITTTGTIGLASTVQNWSSQPACTAGNHIQSIAANGTPTCVPDATGTVTSVKTGPGLTGGTITTTGTLDIASTVQNWPSMPNCTQGTAALVGIGSGGAANCLSVTSSAPGHGGIGYAWVDPTGAVQTNYSYNSSGLPISVTRSSVGNYVVKFLGLTAPPSPYAPPYGHPQVSAYITGTPTFCSVGNGSNYPLATVNVLCYSLSAGAMVPTDTYFNILWIP